MKRLTKIFMAVVALFAYSCATDATGDLGVEYGGDKGLTIISLSLEDNTRVHLGEKDYELFWSKGDKIALNGTASNPLPEEYHGQKTASFTFSGDGNFDAFPRMFVYPAPEQGVTPATAGNQVVTFLATQEYKDGTFAEGATPMYAYVEEEDVAVTLTHLAGVLCFQPKGVGVVLNSMTVTAEKGYLAGNFDLTTEGVLTAHADASNTVNVTFVEGLPLDSGAPIYVAVPAGDYGKVSATFFTNEGAMVASFQTSGEKEDGTTKAILAGTVREFGEFEYRNNILYVKDEATLGELGNVGAGQTYKKALFTADVDMTGKSWTPIDNEEHFVLDGGGHKVIGLAAPLFGHAKVSIDNLHLENVNISVTDYWELGALICHLTESVSGVNNCSVSGSITANFTSDIVKPEDGANIMVAGVVGRFHSDVNAYNVNNSADINVTGAVTNTFALGGCFGEMNQGADHCTNTGKLTFSASASMSVQIGGVCRTCNSMTNCTNGSAEDTTHELGSIEVSGALSSASNLLIGGVIEQTSAAESCYNYGNITYNNTATSSGEQTIGGVVRYISGSSAEKLYNSGEITIDGKISGVMTIGGIVSKIAASTTYYDCHNTGAIEVTANAQGMNGSYVGGFVGDQTAAPSTIEECSNNGPISFYGTNKTTSATAIQLGGIIAKNMSSQANVLTINESSNGENGDITYNASNSKSPLLVGGVVARMTGSTTNKITLTNSDNNGDITITGVANYVYCGGIIGQQDRSNTLTIGDVTNYGAVTLNEITTSSSDTWVGGVFGRYAAAMTINGPIKNEGTVTYTSTTAPYGRLGVGGIAGIVGASLGDDTYKMINTGKIVSTGAGKSGKTNGVGGIVGLLSSSLKNCWSYCTVEVPADYSELNGVLVGNDQSGSVINCNAGGSIKRGDVDTPLARDNYWEYIFGTASTIADVTTYNNGWLSSIEAEPQYPVIETGVVEIGTADDLLAFASNAGEALKVKVTATIDMSGKEWSPIEGFAGTFDGGNFEIQGLPAPLFGTTTASKIENVKLVDVNIVNCELKYKYGALACEIDNEIAVVTNCSATGTLSFKVECSEELVPEDEFWVSGLIGNTTSTQTFSGLTNEVNIDIQGSYTKTLRVSGLLRGASCSIENSTNKGNIEYKATNTTEDTYTYISGITGRCVSLNNCHNEGTLSTIDGSTSNAPYFGGIIAVTGTATFTATGCTNSGAINVGGASTTLHVGGFTASVNGSTTFDTCTNSGAITIAATASSTTYSCIGGMFGLVDAVGYTSTIMGCLNEGDINIYSANLTNSTYDTVFAHTSSSRLRTSVSVGGVAGTASAGNLFMADIANGETYTNKNSGNITYDAKSDDYLHISGGVARVASSKNTTNTGAQTRITNFTNEGDISVNGEAYEVMCAGIVAQNSKTHFSFATKLYIGDVTNTGAISVGVTTLNDCYIGGIFGRTDRAYGWMKGDLVNEGEVKFTGNATSRIMMGGIEGMIYSIETPVGCRLINKGNVTCLGDGNTSSRVGGIAGIMTSVSAKQKADVYACYATVTCTSTNAKWGMYTGDSASNGGSPNLYIGGQYSTESGIYNTLGEADAAGDYIGGEWVDGTSAFYKYIYGSSNPEDKPDNCTLWDGVLTNLPALN